MPNNPPFLLFLAPLVSFHSLSQPNKALSKPAFGKAAMPTDPILRLRSLEPTQSVLLGQGTQVDLGSVGLPQPVSASPRSPCAGKGVAWGRWSSRGGFARLCHVGRDQAAARACKEAGPHSSSPGGRIWPRSPCSGSAAATLPPSLCPFVPRPLAKTIPPTFPHRHTSTTSKELLFSVCFLLPIEKADVSLQRDFWGASP